MTKGRCCNGPIIMKRIAITSQGGRGAVRRNDSNSMAAGAIRHQETALAVNSDTVMSKQSPNCAASEFPSATSVSPFPARVLTTPPLKRADAVVCCVGYIKHAINRNNTADVGKFVR